MLDLVAAILAFATPLPLESYSRTIAGWWLHPENSTECRMEMKLPSGIWVAFTENPRDDRLGSFVMTGDWKLDRHGRFPITYSFDNWQTHHDEFAQGRNFADGRAMVVIPSNWRTWYMIATSKRVSFRVPAGNIDVDLDLPDFSWVSTNLRYCNASLRG